MPAIYDYRAFAAAGGLMSYGTSLVDASRLEGDYAGRIFKGEKPADLPVQQATKVPGWSKSRQRLADGSSAHEQVIRAGGLMSAGRDELARAFRISRRRAHAGADFPDAPRNKTDRTRGRGSEQSHYRWHWQAFAGGRPHEVNRYPLAKCCCFSTSGRARAIRRPRRLRPRPTL